MFPLHDRGYKRLFSHPRLFQQLLENFVEEAWVKELDFDQCEKVEKSFISDHYKETESDLLYQVYHSKSEAKQVLETMIAQERERIFAQGEAQGWARGKAEGETEGWARGKAEGQAEFLVFMLETRFGSLNQKQKEYIYTLDATRLLALAEKLWRIESWSEIFLESDEDK